MSTILDKCEHILNFAPSKFVDTFAKKQLAKDLKKFQRSREKKLADVSYKVDDKNYSSLLDAIYIIEEWDDLEIHFFHPNTEEHWEYDIPTKLLKLTQPGKGALMLFQVDHFSLNQWDPKKVPIFEPAMFRCYLSNFYSPESIKSHADKVDERPLVPPRPLCSPFELWDDIRLKGIVPFQMTLCAYSHERRYLYQLDLTNNTLLMDFRNGKIPIKNRVFRDPLDYYHLDNFLSSQELPDLAKKVFTIFFELEDANAADIEIGLGITEKMAQNNITALAKRGLIEALGKPPKAKYVINMENIRKLSTKIK
jgi:hypothetical protein